VGDQGARACTGVRAQEAADARDGEKKTSNALLREVPARHHSMARGGW